MPPLQVDLVFSMYLFHYVSLLCSQGSSSMILSDQIARRLGQLRSEVVLYVFMGRPKYSAQSN
jgi:hypothetical protein